MTDLAHMLLCCIAPLLVASSVNAAEKGAPVDNDQSRGEENSTVLGQDILSLMEFKESDADWRIINDTVMGGMSSSRFRILKGLAVFEGQVSLENNGGFASVRSQPGNDDLSKTRGLLLRVRGDGKSYSFRLRTTEAFDGISYET
jgi:hypothetical protein